MAELTIEHFGEMMRPGKYGHRLTREMYALVNKKPSTRIPEHMLTDELRAFLAPHYEDAELTILTDEFCRRQREAALENLDLNMAFYVGQSSWDMRKRIKAHWNGTKQFDRLLWGGVEESVMSIDSFRALDTTRIFAARTINYDALESRLVRTFPPDYLLNRIGGGAVTGLRAMFISAEMKRRQLPTDDSAPPVP